MTIWTPDITDAANARYQAIADEIERGISDQSLLPGSKLPTHRALADQLGVTVGTVTRAYAEAEKRGLVSARVGSGTFIRDAGHADKSQFAIMSNEQRSRIDFTQNLPVPTDNQQILQQTLQDIAADTACTELLGYQPERGIKRHRQWAAQWLGDKGVNTSADNITITGGGQHAITLALTCTTRPGESILCEGLTYPGLNAVATQLGIKTTGLDMDEEGIIPQQLEKYCQKGHYRALYCIPVAQNPTNANMSQARRAAILEIAERYHLWIIEDAVLTTGHSTDTGYFHNINPERSLLIFSHSKVQAGGLRVGYLVTPQRLNSPVANSIRAHCWFTSPITVEIAQRWADKQAAQHAQDMAREELGKRIALARHYLQDFEVRIFDHSFHCWLKLPEPWRALDFQARMKEKDVGILAAESFAVGSYPAPQAIRISLSSPQTTEQVERGLRMIAHELRREIGARLSVF
ncbi:MAG: PLP-dependent aminotransferase family protein [Thiolinea sp.]